jgi:hypothetical protein
MLSRRGSSGVPCGLDPAVGLRLGMINGAHAIVYSTNAEADRAFLRDLLRLPYVDVGDGWLIFALPPSEIAVHPADENGRQELYFLCDDVAAFATAMRRHKIACGPIQQQAWGRTTEVTLPGGGTVVVYQPRHARPEKASTARRPSAGRAKKPRSRGVTKARR